MAVPMSAERVLVVRAGALGDTLMTTPLLRALARTFPESSVDVLCAAGVAPLLERDPHVGEAFGLKWRNLPYAVSAEKRALVRELRARGYAFAVLLERREHYRRLLERAGVRDIRSFRETPFDPGSHAIVNNLRAAGLDGVADLDMEAHETEADAFSALALLSGLERPWVGIHMGYGPRTKKRRQTERLKGWPRDSFRALADGLIEKGASLVFTGASEDASDVEAVVRGLPVSRLRNVTGRTSVPVLGSLLRRLDLLVSVDSGPAHLAAAVGTPLVVLWGPAILEQVRPMSSRSPVVIIRHAVPCAPCYDTPLMKTCQKNICMEGISPEAVLGRASAILRQRAARI